MREIPTPTFDLSPIALPRGLLHRPIQPHLEQVQQIAAAKLDSGAQQH